jgi:uncharacterized repeat protein (TIGR03943 family)
MSRFHAIWQSVLLGAFGGLLVHYYSVGALVFFIYPAYNGMVLASAWMLILLAVFQLFAATENQSEEPLLYKDFISLGALTLILLLALALPPRPLSSATALARGLSTDLAVVNGQMQTFGLKPEDRTLLDWVKLFNYNPEPQAYVGQKVALEGFIVLDESLPESTFMITRFSMACCAADARPIALPVHFDSQKFTPLQDDWVYLEGHMEETTLNGQRRAWIQLDFLESRPVPLDPYAY